MGNQGPPIDYDKISICSRGLLNLDGSFDLLPGLDSPNGDKLVTAFTSSGKKSREGGTKAASQTSSLLASGSLKSQESFKKDPTPAAKWQQSEMFDLVKRVSPPRPPGATSSHDDNVENTDPTKNSGVFLDDQLDKAIRRSLEGVKIQDGSAASSVGAAKPTPVKHLGKSAAFSSQANSLSLEGSKSRSTVKSSSGSSSIFTPSKKAAAVAPGSEGSSSFKRKIEMPKRLFAPHKGVGMPSLKPPIRKPLLVASTPIMKEEHQPQEKRTARRSLMPDSSTKKKPPILPSKMIASRSDEKVGVAKPARRSLLPSSFSSNAATPVKSRIGQPGPSHTPGKDKAAAASTLPRNGVRTPSVLPSYGGRNKNVTPAGPNATFSTAKNTTFAANSKTPSVNTSFTSFRKSKKSVNASDSCSSRGIAATPSSVRVNPSRMAQAPPLSVPSSRIPGTPGSGVKTAAATPSAHSTPAAATPTKNGLFRRQGSLRKTATAAGEQAKSLAAAAATPSRMARRSLMPMPSPAASLHKKSELSSSSGTHTASRLVNARRSLMPQK